MLLKRYVLNKSLPTDADVCVWSTLPPSGSRITRTWAKPIAPRGMFFSSCRAVHQQYRRWPSPIPGCNAFWRRAPTERLVSWQQDLNLATVRIARRFKLRGEMQPTFNKKTFRDQAEPSPAQRPGPALKSVGRRRHPHP
jgi:hypothetical protein